MKYVKIIGLTAACLLAAYVGQVYAQNNSSHIKVGVYVRGEEDLIGLIENYMTKELTSLGDITVTYSQLDCAIDIVVKKLKNGNSNAKNGCTLSVTIVDRFDSFPITRAIEELDTIIPKIKAQPIVIKRLEELSKELVGIVISTAKIKRYHNSFLYTESVDHLPELCSKIVNGFNNDYLKEKRKVIRKKQY